MNFLENSFDLAFIGGFQLAGVVALVAFGGFSIWILLFKKTSDLFEVEYQEVVVNDNLINRETNEQLVKRIEDYFVDNHHFLNPCFDLDQLSHEVQIPKVLLSAIINRVMNKNFYLLLAEYRIEYAKNLLIKHDSLFKIESVIYECGFNSKSSFHKYFKQLEGTTPSCFRANYFRKKANCKIKGPPQNVHSNI